MADEQWQPFAKPTKRAPTPSEPVWEFRKDHVEWSAVLRFHGESYGWEAQILRGGDLFASHRFLLKAAAIGWAEEQRGFY